LAELDKRLVSSLALGGVAVVGLLLLGHEVLTEGPPGESRNPNYGHPTKVKTGVSHLAGGDIRDMTEDNYYQALKINRPDLSESELRAKSDHWWKVKNGEAQVTGG
jgi:hypothetical protein